MFVSDRWCALGLGSNLGDRELLLERVEAALARLPGLRDPRRAPIYETTPVDCPPGSPPFLNTVVQAHYTGHVLDLLRATQAIETALGRERGLVRNAPRPVDIDLLMIEGVEMDRPDLTLPHPRLRERLFVLLPLADLRPELELSPGSSIAEAIASLPAQPSCRRLP